MINTHYFTHLLALPDTTVSGSFIATPNTSGLTLLIEALNIYVEQKSAKKGKLLKATALRVRMFIVKTCGRPIEVSSFKGKEIIKFPLSKLRNT
jgi:hypothetical protein